MSESDSEFLSQFRAIFEEANRAWNEGDFKRAYAALPDDFDYRPTPEWPNARSLRGSAEVVEFFEDLRESFPDVQSGPFDFIEVDERTAIVGFPVVGTGRSSGVNISMEIWQVWEVGPGLIPVRVTEFPDRRSALEATGVGESATRGG
jgi:hypothetical protein